MRTFKPFLLTLGFGLCSWLPLFAQSSFPFHWGAARKDAIGAAYEKGSSRSLVWWTVAEGKLSEIYFPQIDSIQVSELKFLFLFDDGTLLTQEELSPTVNYQDAGMLVNIKLNASERKFKATQKIVSDPRTSRVQTRLEMKCHRSCPRTFVYFKPAIQGKATLSALQLTADGVRAFGPNHRSTPVASSQVSLQATTRWLGKVLSVDHPSQPLISALKQNKALPVNDVTMVGPDQVTFLGEVAVAKASPTQGIIEVALSFFAAEEILPTPLQPLRAWNNVELEYQKGWKSFLQKASRKAPWLRKDKLAQKSLQLLQMHGDKLNPGAYIAAFSAPGIPDLAYAFEDYAGYHLVWPRDLYHVASGFMAINDWATVRQILSYLVQRQLPEGHWPQNFWLNGTPSWTSLQLDEVGYPILLAKKLSERSMKLTTEELEMVRKAATFIAAHGPRTPQERWEELGGYSPNTLAIEIAALRAASDMLGENQWLARAQEWDERLESWILVKNGAFGSDYYLRISPQGTPELEEMMTNARGQQVAASSILDLGFLDLARWKVRSPQHPPIVNTLKLIMRDDFLHKNGYYRRYSGDHYGFKGTGGYWPLLTGELGEYHCDNGNKAAALDKLRLFRKSQTEQGHLPEQLSSPPENALEGASVALNSASPLAWAHSGYLRLAERLQHKCRLK